MATTRLATRTGPTTEYTEPGTFYLEGSYVKIVSIAYDENGVPWVQCEISEGYGLMRVYTGLKRFDAATVALPTFDLDGLKPAPIRRTRDFCRPSFRFL